MALRLVAARVLRRGHSWNFAELPGAAFRRSTSGGGGSARNYVAVAIDKLLDATPWRLVQLRFVTDKPESRSELPVQRRGVVPQDVQPAAFRRTIGTERGNDDVPANPHRP